MNGLILLLGVIVGNASVLLKNKDKFGVDCVNAMTSVAFVAQVNTIVLQIIVLLINDLMFQALFKLHEFMIALKETLVLTKCALEGEIALARNVNVIQIGLVKTVLVV